MLPSHIQKIERSSVVLGERNPEADSQGKASGNVGHPDGRDSQGIDVRGDSDGVVAAYNGILLERRLSEISVVG
jgi:hypothetical protein